MQKSKLNRFIEKYHLGGNVNSVALTTNDNNLETRFMSGDKSLLGELKMKNWKFENSELGVYDTEQLIKLLSVLGEDITIDLSASNGKSVALKVKDDNASVNYMLSDLSVINKPPQLKNTPEFELRLKVDSTFIKKFIAGKKALSETDSFTVLSDGKSVKIVIGYSSINTNRVTIPAESENYVDIENVSFNANLFSDVLTANGECESATLEISSQGLGRINFKVDDYDVTYWLVATTTVD
tara:strand:+ start:219 stop:938 length:720 start_codon:yes stop_codon:yes gene_type:complete